MSILNTTADIFKLMRQLKREIYVNDLIANLNMPKSTASRILNQLVDAGFLEKEPDKHAFKIGQLMFEVTHSIGYQVPLAEQILPLLNQVCQLTHHTGYISLLSEQDVLVLNAIAGSHPLRVVTEPGTRSSAIDTSTGRAILARMSDEEIKDWFFTSYATNKDAQQLYTQLMQRITNVRKNRYSFAINETIPGAASVSCAIFDIKTNKYLAFCLTFPVAQDSDEQIKTLSQHLKKVAKTIGAKVGDTYWIDHE